MAARNPNRIKTCIANHSKDNTRLAPSVLLVSPAQEKCVLRLARPVTRASTVTDGGSSRVWKICRSGMGLRSSLQCRLPAANAILRSLEGRSAAGHGVCRVLKHAGFRTASGPDRLGHRRRPWAPRVTGTRTSPGCTGWRRARSIKRCVGISTGFHWTLCSGCLARRPQT